MVKKFVLLFVFFSLLCFYTRGGVFTVSFDSSTVSGPAILTLLNSPGTAKNLTGSPLMLRMTILSTDLNSAWDISMCNFEDGCLPNGVTTTTFTLSPNQEGWISIDFWLGNTPDTGSAVIRLNDENNPSDYMDFTLSAIAYSSTGILTFHDEKEEVYLLQNFPNPFNTSTTITYNLHGKNGKILISDVTGRIIEQYDLTPSYKEEEIIIKGNFPPGLYFCILSVEGKARMVKKLSLME